MVVLSLWDDAILTLDGFSYFESVSEADRAILLAGDSYWDQLRSDNLKNEGDIKSPLLFGNPENNLDYLLTPEYESSVVNSYNIELPVKYHVYDYDVSILGSKIKFPYSSFEHNSLEQLELLESHFDSVYYYTYQPDLPMIYDNPDDPLFGEPVTKVDSATGLISFVYPPTEFVTYWIDYNPQFIVQRQFQNTDELNLVSTHLVLLEQSNGDLNYVGFQKLDEDWRAYLDMLIYENPWTSFRAEMHDLLMGGKKVMLDKQKHRDKLNMSPSFWKRYNLN
jgi:hypothetical protein